MSIFRDVILPLGIGILVGWTVPWALSPPLPRWAGIAISMVVVVIIVNGLLVSR